ncbi:hypothetical protein F5Y03DRAFT_395694 [Xylaria venustula]|nr:hypothetical protein F5Y03DRAFT_395694 [Xylaria venustula]
MWTMQEATSPRPVCAHCKRRKEVCDYSLEYSTVTTGSVVPAVTKDFRCLTETSISAALITSNTAPQPSLILQESLVNVVRWFRTSCEPPETMVSKPHLETFEYKPQYASNPQIFHYLVPYVTAVSALCSLSRDRSREPQLLQSAYAANMAASQAFRAVEREVNGTNWPAILLFSLCNLMFHFAAAAQFTEPRDFDFLEVFTHVLRGTGSIRRQLMERLIQMGFLKEPPPLFFAHDSVVPPPSLTTTSHIHDGAAARTHAAFALLASARHPADTSAATQLACGEALALLKQWAAVVDGAPDKWSHFFYWPCAVSQTFVSALSAHQPVAVLVFVHWCAVMSRAPRTWFLEGWARRTAFAAVATLEGYDDYHDFLRWPVSIFDLDDPA